MSKTSFSERPFCYAFGLRIPKVRKMHEKATDMEKGQKKIKEMNDLKNDYYYQSLIRT